jgi:hypothetical protein
VLGFFLGGVVMVIFVKNKMIYKHLHSHFTSTLNVPQKHYLMFGMKITITNTKATKIDGERIILNLIQNKNIVVDTTFT